jgi:GNAT superfamily N-acetyltransferase
LLASPNDLVLVAESSEGLLVGWTHAFLSQLLESDYRVEIGGLVVDKNFQRHGVGRELIRRIEQWAADHGVKQISVRCKTSRLEAHQFYENLDYRAAKTQTAFRKSLN